MPRSAALVPPPTDAFQVRGAPSKRLALVAVAVLFVVAIAFLGVTSQGSDARLVSVQRVERGTLRDRIATVANGRVGAERELVLRAEVGGTVRARRYRAGDAVPQGESLLTLETPELAGRIRLQRAAVGVAKAQVNEAHARAALARSRAHIARRLAVSKARPAAELEAADAELRIAEGAVGVARAIVAEREAALAVSEQDLARAEIRAPFAGLILSIAIEEGELVMPGAALVTLADTSALHVDAAIDEVDALRARPGLLAELRFEGASGPPLIRPVSRVAPSIDSDARGARTAAVRIDLKHDDRFPIGAGVEVDIVVSERENALLVPASALLGGGASRELLVVSDGTVRRRRVHVSLVGSREAAATSGVSPGELVVLAARSNELPEGTKVRWHAASTGAPTARN